MSGFTDRLEYRLALARVADPAIGWVADPNRVGSLPPLRAFDPVLRGDVVVTRYWVSSRLPFDIESVARLSGLPFAIVDCLGPESAGTLAGLDLRAADRLAISALINAELAARDADRLARDAANLARRDRRRADRADRRWARWAADALIALGDPDAIAARDRRLADRESARVSRLADLIAADFDRLLAYDAIVARIARINRRAAVARSVIPSFDPITNGRVWGFVARSAVAVVSLATRAGTWSAASWLASWAPNLYGPFARPDYLLRPRRLALC
jgi:hypothetical protein